MGEEQKEKTALAPIFETLKHGYIESDNPYSFSARIGGRRVSLFFPSEAHAAEAKQCFKGMRILNAPEPDARLYFGAGDCSRYIEQDSAGGVRRYREGDRQIISSPNRWLIAADAPNRTFYSCTHDPEKRAPIPYWRVSALVSQWAETAGLIPVHGAAVGTGGRGVLLIANGGGGKSTLAASCLLSGMDYAGDDYVLLSSQGAPAAMPLFSTLKLNPDMKKELRLDLPVIFEDASRGGKQLLDASSFPICRNLIIGATIFINRDGSDSPEIAKASGYPSVRLAGSAVRTEGARDPLAAKSLVQRLSKLPAYDMHLSRNLEQNADALRAWIERME